jgi:class 3 adenylate cyclase
MVEPAVLLDVTSVEQRSQRMRRRVLRVGIPVACVIVMLGAILAIAMFSHHQNRRDALALSDDLLRELQRRIATEVNAYLAPAADMARLAAGVLQNQAFGTDFPAGAEALAVHILENYPQLATVNVADTRGNFLMPKRMPDGSIHTKRIERTDAATRVTWRRRNLQGKVLAMEEAEDDGYDPRVRPWYHGAVSSRKLYWSDIYIFFTDQKPGVTVSLPIIADDSELRGVLGLDIDLEQLSGFLARLQIGRSGRAMIIDEAGRLVAYPDLTRLFKRVGTELQPVRLDDLNDTVLTRAFNRFRVEGHGYRALDVDGRRHISTVSSLHTTIGRHWSVMIVVPEEDFVGFVTRNNRQALALSLIIVALAALLAGLLVRQGLRADRNAQLVLERQQQLEAQSRAFAALASQAALFDPADADSLATLTEIASGTAGVRRVSLWRLVDGGAWLVCDNCYDRESGGHTQGALLSRHDLPQLFAVIDRGDDLGVLQAISDPRTAELHRLYLLPFGCDALLAVPIVNRDIAIGSVWFEDESRAAPWSPETYTFARAIAGMLALRLNAATRAGSDSAVVAGFAPQSTAAGQVPDAAVSSVVSEGAAGTASPSFAPRRSMRTTAIVDDRASAFIERLAARGRGRQTKGVQVYPDTTVLVGQFTDPLSLAERPDDAAVTSVVDHLVCYLEDLAAAHRIEYLKLMNAEIVCAAGFDGNPDHGARVLADVALDMQERCVRLFANLHTRMEFRLGMDTGAVIGSSVGRGEQSYNLWGEAVRAAQWMAETSLAGCIQGTESTYRRLRDRYLFKVRGTYYLRDVGELSTYIITGRI